MAAGAFLFEDLGATAFAGAIPLLTSTAAQSAAAGILGVEAYHGGLLRQWLFENGARLVDPFPIQIVSFVQVCRPGVVPTFGVETLDLRSSVLAFQHCMHQAMCFAG